jgi:hypothetical protein
MPGGYFFFVMAWIASLAVMRSSGSCDCNSLLKGGSVDFGLSVEVLSGILALKSHCRRAYNIRIRHPPRMTERKT